MCSTSIYNTLNQRFLEKMLIMLLSCHSSLSSIAIRKLWRTVTTGWLQATGKLVPVLSFAVNKKCSGFTLKIHRQKCRQT